MKLDSWLANQVRDGNAILFLGAGAIVGAKTPDGISAPTASALRDLIADTFLNGEKKDSPLSLVSDYAISISHLKAVQKLVKDQFIDLVPADFHYTIPRFRWQAIFESVRNFV